MFDPADVLAGLRIGLVKAAAEEKREMRFFGSMNKRPVSLEGLGDGRHQPLGGDKRFESAFDGWLQNRPYSRQRGGGSFAESVKPPPLREIGRPAKLHETIRVIGRRMPGGSVGDFG